MTQGKKTRRRGHQQPTGGVRASIPRGAAGAAGGSVDAAADQSTDLAAFIALLRQNPAGLWGLGLSLLQLAGHVTWLMLVANLAGTAEAEQLNASSPLAWVIVGLLGGSLLLTGISLFVCLFFGLRKTPRAPALAGAAMAFFVGVLVSAAVFLQGLRSLSAP
ncbi:MAG: hypothetical protein ACKO2P_20615 [Planctomycetota bacterium]